MSEQRLARIEDAIGALTKEMSEMKQVLVAIARMEEKHIAHSQRLDHHDTRLNKHSEELDSLQVAQAQSATKTNTNEWFVRLMVAALVGAIAYIIKT